jgi:hypothetical protein
MRSLQISVILFAILGAIFLSWDMHHKLRPEPVPVIDRSFSWDQQTLKAHDVGCPYAVFIAPGGDLEECP